MSEKRNLRSAGNEICKMREIRQMEEMVNMRMRNDKRGKWEIKRNQKM